MPNWTALFPDAETSPAAARATRPAKAAETAGPRRPGQIRIDPDNARNGLMQLVLTLVELLRDLLERQAIRRIDGGTLTRGGDRAAGSDVYAACGRDGAIETRVRLLR